MHKCRGHIYSLHIYKCMVFHAKNVLSQIMLQYKLCFHDLIFCFSCITYLKICPFTNMHRPLPDPRNRIFIELLPITAYVKCWFWVFIDAYLNMHVTMLIYTWFSISMIGSYKNIFYNLFPIVAHVKCWTHSGRTP